MPTSRPSAAAPAAAVTAAMAIVPPPRPSSGRTSAPGGEGEPRRPRRAGGPSRPGGRRPLARGRAATIVLAVVAIASVVGGGAWWWLAQGRLPLAGPASHDFGTVSIQGDEALLAHEFVLTNRRGEPVRIVRAVPSCGCAAVEYDETAIPPGESVTILGRLALEDSGPRSASVALLLDNGESQRLFMEAVGRKERLVRLEPTRIAVKPDEEVQVLVQARILREEEGEPVELPVPELLVPESVEAEWRGWAFMDEGDPSLLTADGWRGRVALRWTGEEVRPGHSLVVVLPPATPGDTAIRARCIITGVAAPPPLDLGPMPGIAPPGDGAEDAGGDAGGNAGGELDPLATPLIRGGDRDDG